MFMKCQRETLDRKYSMYLSMTFTTNSVVIYSVSSITIDGLSKALKFHTLMIVFHVINVSVNTFVISNFEKLRFEAKRVISLIAI